MQENIKADITAAMRAKDTLKLETLRGLVASFSNELLKKAGAKVLSDDDAVALIRRAVKQRRDSIEQFEKGGRQDLADKEKAELAILESYLPKLMSREEIEAFVKGKVAGGLVLDKAKAGQSIGMLMKELKGKADGTEVKAVVEGIME